MRNGIGQLNRTAIEFVERLLDQASRLPFLIAVDGRGGAGKSTLARQIASELGGTILQGDDFYAAMPNEARFTLAPQAGYEQLFDWRQMREVLLALRDDRRAAFRKFDWKHDRPAQSLSEITVDKLLIVEGVYTCRPELRDLYDVTILVSTNQETCRQRVHDRGENSEAEIDMWCRAEEWYFEHVLNAGAFDIVVTAE
ncbi:MAG: AAA family ATPase [Planctomycetaceae bacterium]|nr:AAA family ATPase [Planctomycetaceae bacterium]